MKPTGPWLGRRSASGSDFQGKRCYCDTWLLGELGTTLWCSNSTDRDISRWIRAFCLKSMWGGLWGWYTLSLVHLYSTVYREASRGARRGSSQMDKPLTGLSGSATVGNKLSFPGKVFVMQLHKTLDILLPCPIRPVYHLKGSMEIVFSQH